MDTMRHEVWIKADTQTVFDAIATQAGLDGWWGKAVSAEPKVGHVVELDHGHGAPILMRIIELEPNDRLVWRCVSDHPDPQYPGSDWLGTELSFTLSSAADDPVAGWLASELHPGGSPSDLTILRFEHRGWKPNARWFAFCNGAWGATLNDKLVPYCESRSPSAS